MKISFECYRTISSQFESSSKELASTTLPWFKFIFWPCWVLTEERAQWEPCFILPPPGCYWKPWDESEQHRCCTQSLKAKHSAAIILEHLGNLKDNFLLLRSKQKNTFYVDINFYNTTLKTKQPPNSIDCTQDGNASKLEAAHWHFSQKKNIYMCVYTQALFIFCKISEALGLIPTSLSQRQGQAGLRSAWTLRHEKEFVYPNNCVCALEVVSSTALSNPRCCSLILPIQDRDLNLRGACLISLLPGQSYQTINKQAANSRLMRLKESPWSSPSQLRTNPCTSSKVS